MAEVAQRKAGKLILAAFESFYWTTLTGCARINVIGISGIQTFDY